MEKAVAVAKDEFAGIRTGRVTPAMFSRIVVDYYGATTPVNQLASFTVPEARMAIVSPYDKSSLPAIEKAIRDSDLGVNPSNDGSIIRCVFPEPPGAAARRRGKGPPPKGRGGRGRVRNPPRPPMGPPKKNQ